MIGKLFLFTICLFCSFTFGYSQCSIEQLSEKIYKKQKKDRPKNLDPLLDPIGKFKEIRNMKDLQIKLDGNLKDTLYILEVFNLANGEFYGKIWNNNININYNYSSGKLRFLENSYFSDYICNLITQWDIDKIRKGEQIYLQVISPLTIYASFVRCNNRKFKIKSTHFIEFIKE